MLVLVEVEANIAQSAGAPLPLSLRVISICGGESQRGSVTVRMILLMRVGIGGEQPEEK